MTNETSSQFLMVLCATEVLMMVSSYTSSRCFYKCLPWDSQLLSLAWVDFYFASDVCCLFCAGCLT